MMKSSTIKLRTIFRDLDCGAELFSTTFGYLLVFASTWPIACYRQMTRLATNETAVLKHMVRIMTAHGGMAVLAITASGTTPSVPMMT